MGAVYHRRPQTSVSLGMFLKSMTIWHLWEQNELALSLQREAGSWLAWSWSLLVLNSRSWWVPLVMPFFVPARRERSLTFALLHYDKKLYKSYVSEQEPSKYCLIGYDLDESWECYNFVYALKKWGVWPFPVVTLSLSTWVSLNQIAPGLQQHRA